MELRNTRTTILNEGSADAKREEIREYFHLTYTIDEQLYDTLARDEAFYLRPEPLRHPLIFYLGHTAVFYINKLTIAKMIDHRINPRFESMFAIGVDEMSLGRSRRFPLRLAERGGRKNLPSTRCVNWLTASSAGCP